MSVLVFDGETLAADSHIQNGQLTHRFDKIIEVPANAAMNTPRVLAGGVGSLDQLGPALQWVIDGQRKDKVLTFWGGAQLVVITKDKGLVRFVRDTRTPFLHGFNKLAIGEGAPFAYGAMTAMETLGTTGGYTPAWVAVEAAIEHSPQCNGEPITLKL